MAPVKLTVGAVTYARNGQKMSIPAIGTRYVRKYQHLGNMRPGEHTNHTVVEHGQTIWQQQNALQTINTHNSIIISQKNFIHCV